MVAQTQNLKIMDITRNQERIKEIFAMKHIKVRGKLSQLIDECEEIRLITESDAIKFKSYLDELLQGENFSDNQKEQGKTYV